MFFNYIPLRKWNIGNSQRAFEEHGLEILLPKVCFPFSLYTLTSVRRRVANSVEIIKPASINSFTDELAGQEINCTGFLGNLQACSLDRTLDEVSSR